MKSTTHKLSPTNRRINQRVVHGLGGFMNFFSFVYQDKILPQFSSAKATYT